MKKKLAYLFVMSLLIALSLTTPDRVAACSGDDCGCTAVEIQCEANCPPRTYPIPCIPNCVRVYTACAVACCS